MLLSDERWRPALDRMRSAVCSVSFRLPTDWRIFPSWFAGSVRQGEATLGSRTCAALPWRRCNSFGRGSRQYHVRYFPDIEDVALLLAFQFTNSWIKREMPLVVLCWIVLQRVKSNNVSHLKKADACKQNESSQILLHVGCLWSGIEMLTRWRYWLTCPQHPPQQHDQLAALQARYLEFQSKSSLHQTPSDTPSSTFRSCQHCVNLQTK